MKDYGLDEMDLLTNNSNSLVMFYADWCPYCSKIKKKVKFCLLLKKIGTM